VLVIGPNRVFLRYIERVLPSLGEAGVEQVVLNDLVPDVHFGGRASQAAARVKGDPRTNTDPEAPILARADYAVIGDLHEVVPAISAELRRVRGA